MDKGLAAASGCEGGNRVRSSHFRFVTLIRAIKSNASRLSTLVLVLKYASWHSFLVLEPDASQLSTLVLVFGPRTTWLSFLSSSFQA